jgi:hypothetical protein
VKPGRAVLVWLLIIAAESIHGTLRQLYVAPAVGDLPARQLGVFIGSAIVLAIAWLCSNWLGARKLGHQLQAGALWVLLTVVFEFSLGRVLGYSWQRLLADYNLAAGGLMGLGLLFMLFAPALAARLRSRCHES